MIDHPVRASRTMRRERALADARERLRHLEIETHRIKAELARLEAEFEDEVADELSRDFYRPGIDGSRSFRASFAPPAARPRQVELMSPKPATEQLPIADTKRRRAISPAWVLSLGVHAAILAVLAPLTFVVLSDDRTPLLASMFDVESNDLDEPGAAPIELVSYEETVLSDEIVEQPAEIAENLIEDFAPPDLELSGPAAESLGQLNTLPTDIGTLMAGGDTGTRQTRRSRRRAGNDNPGLGTTSFFGTPARANRAVFLVDNSGSMKQGRMETTLFELARSVEAMNEKQEFYVAFYSDQAYPMFYPQSVLEPVAATRENKQRLYRWLHTVELCSGGKLLEAIELAESLNPQVVFVLSDGSIHGTKTMQRLTEPNEREFAIHTLGMGVANPQDAQKLSAIAQANHGTFRMVQPLPAAVQAAKLRPIRSNGFGVAWGAGTQQPPR